MGRAAGYTPLCPAGHLPHKGGDRQDAPASRDIDRALIGFGYLRCLTGARGRSHPISPLVGEMLGRAEGGAAAARSLHRKRQAMPHTPVPPQRRANARRMRKAMTDNNMGIHIIRIIGKDLP
ncbi:hypothetical protein AMC87_CH01442 [Rhizobium phaseoli]|nr:hypothetical protein AMC87_CH01442 [Rhizobium phaseoli]